MSQVYLIQSGACGPLKIGFTACDVAKRLTQLQTGNPQPLRLVASIPGTKQIERHLHGAFSDLRLTGEWFAADDRIFTAFAAAGKWPADPATMPPVTPQGMKLLRQFLATEEARPVYPDGSAHSETDWDDLAKEIEADCASYVEWCSGNG